MHHDLKSQSQQQHNKNLDVCCMIIWETTVLYCITVQLDLLNANSFSNYDDGLNTK